MRKPYWMTILNIRIFWLPNIKTSIRLDKVKPTRQTKIETHVINFQSAILLAYLEYLLSAKINFTPKYGLQDWALQFDADVA